MSPTLQKPLLLHPNIFPFSHILLFLEAISQILLAILSPSPKSCLGAVGPRRGLYVCCDIVPEIYYIGIGYHALLLNILLHDQIYDLVEAQFQ